jgi:hypothetical protein
MHGGARRFASERAHLGALVRSGSARPRHRRSHLVGPACSPERRSPSGGLPREPGRPRWKRRVGEPRSGVEPWGRAAICAAPSNDQYHVGPKSQGPKETGPDVPHRGKSRGAGKEGWPSWQRPTEDCGSSERWRPSGSPPLRRRARRPRITVRARTSQPRARRTRSRRQPIRLGRARGPVELAQRGPEPPPPSTRRRPTPRRTLGGPTPRDRSRRVRPRRTIARPPSRSIAPIRSDGVYVPR